MNSEESYNQRTKLYFHSSEFKITILCSIS